MGIFNRDNKEAASETQFTRLLLHQVISYSTYLSDWQRVNIFLVHIELNKNSLLKLSFNDSIFESQSMSFEAAYDAMKRIRSESKNLETFFPEADFTKFAEVTTDWQGNSQDAWSRMDTAQNPFALGFLNPLLENSRTTSISMLRQEIDWPESENLDDLSRGNFLATLLEDPSYVPRTESEINFYWDYLATYIENRWAARGYQPNSNFTIGFFGNFKYILKTLTSKFEDLLEKDPTSSLVADLAGCLGAGYGQVEAYLSKGYLTPPSVLENYYETEKQLVPFEEFGGRHYPSLATGQYLSRKGIRLLNRIETVCPAITGTRFKINALNVADLLDERSAKFANYQLLINRIIFGELTGKLISGRKVTPPQAIDYQALAEKFCSNKDDQERAVVTNWIQNIIGNNPQIVHFAFELSNQLGVEFTFNSKTVKSLSLFDTNTVRKALLNYITENTEGIFWLDLSRQASYLADLPDEVAKKVLNFFGQYYYHPKSLLAPWISYCLVKDLTKRDIEISKMFLDDSLAYGEFKTLELLVKLAETTQFEQFEDWESLLVPRRYGLWLSSEDFLAFLGVDPNKKGILTVLKKANKKLLEIYAQELSVCFTLRYWGLENNQSRVNDTLGKLLNSSNQSMRTIAMIILSKKLLDQNQIANFLNTVSDPTILFELLKLAVEESDGESALSHLIDYGLEDKRVFWRMFSNETEELFKSWSNFPKFLWTNLESLPIYVLEIFKKYSWLPEQIRKLITPASVAKLNSKQAEFFVEILNSTPSYLENPALLRAVLTAPDSNINKIGSNYVKEKGIFSEYWLVMLESNLPVTSRAAELYLESQINTKDFDKKIMSALDSNNKFARSSALRILQSANSPKLLSLVIHKLAENRNQDTWNVVAKNMNLVEEANKLHTFTRRVFLSRRKARAQKEEVKHKISTLVRDLSEVVDNNILVRLSLGAVAKDRDWALRQIVESRLESEEVKIEFAWKAGTDV